MKVLLAALLLLPLPAAADGKVPTTLRMRVDDLDAFFDGSKPRSGAVPQVPDAEPPPPLGKPVAGNTRTADSRGARMIRFVGRVVALEGSASVGGRTNEIEPRLRFDIGNLINALPEIPGKRVFIVDVALFEAATAAGMLATYSAGRIMGVERWQNSWQGFTKYTAEHGPVGIGRVEFKDPNYGDPWVNDFGHPVAFEVAASYFRKRGYGRLKSFLGGTIANLTWEFVWENEEIPKSGHDILYMNLLGAIFGSSPELGIAWGVDPFRFMDSRTHYTEFYYRPSGTPWRVFFRTEPNGNYRYLPDGKTRMPAKDMPLFVSDLSIGAAREDWGVTAFVTGVADTGAKEFSDVHGPGDVVDDVRIGVSYDAARLLR